VTEVVPPGGGRTGERRSILADLLSLTKPRVISLLLVTAVAPMYMTSLGVPSLALVGWVLLGGYLMAGGANAINMWFDRDIDDKMARTRLRPIPAGRLAPLQALTFGVALAATAFVVFWTRVNQLSAWLALGGLLFYVFVYTIWLKRTSTQNIVIGGAAGAVPVLVGWAAVQNSLGWTPVMLFGVMFFWTPPHFWALAIRYADDYRAANVPMLPAVVPLEHAVRQMIGHTVAMVACSLLLVPVADLGPLYTVAAVVLGAIFIVATVWLSRNATPANSMRVFGYSITYVTLLFGAMMLDVLL